MNNESETLISIVAVNTKRIIGERCLKQSTVEAKPFAHVVADLCDAEMSGTTG